MSIKMKRIIAAIIDFYIIVFFAMIPVAIVTFGKLDITSISVVTFLVSIIIVTTVKDTVFKTASVGKKLLKLEVVKVDNSKVSFLDFLKRAITLVLFPLEFLLILTKNRRLGDLFAKTTVRKIVLNKDSNQPE